MVSRGLVRQQAYTKPGMGQFERNESPRLLPGAILDAGSHSIAVFDNSNIF